MIAILSKFFIKKDQDEPGAIRQAYGILCGIVGICLNILLFAGKLIAGSFTGSIAITADAFNNLSDAGSSVVTLIGFRIAAHKPDRDHPFGHGRVEYVCALIVSMLIVVMGIELVISSIEKIAAPEPVDFNILSIVILVVSIAVKLYMAFYNRRIGQKFNASAMKATAMDSLSDAVATAVVLIATLFSKWTGIIIDGWCGVAVALFIFYIGIRSAKDTISTLLGQKADPSFVKEVINIVMAHPEVSGIHDLMVHDYGPGRCMISLHVEVPLDADILEVHDAIDNIEKELQNTLQCNAVIHMDPIATDDEQTLALKSEVDKLIKSLDPRFSLHDFRIVTGPTHTNIIFDLVKPYDMDLSDEEIIRTVSALIQTLNKNYFAVITVDNAYT